MDNTDKIGNRVNFTEKNMLRLDILSSVYKKEIEGLSNRDSFDFIINKVIENPSYFKKVICIENGKEYINITECAKDLFGDKKYKYAISRSILKNKS